MNAHWKTQKQGVFQPCFYQILYAIQLNEIGIAARQTEILRSLQIESYFYLSKTRWLDFAEYTVEFVDDDGEIISSEKYKWQDSVRVPDDPKKPTDDKYSYTFTGWDKDITDCERDAVYVAEYSRTPVSILGFFDMIGSFFVDIFEWIASLFS